jgi:HSP20 family protein
MDPLKDFIGRAWESLSEGWRELLTRSSGSLTRFTSRKTPEGPASPDAARWSLLAAETWETAQSLVIRVEIPGMKKEDLSVDIRGNVLRIRGEKHSGVDRQVRRYHLMERAFGKFERTIPIPQGVDVDRADVTYRDGVLAVILPKAEDVPPRRLDLSD